MKPKALFRLSCLLPNLPWGGEAALALVFIQMIDGNARPNVSAVGAVRTSNGTEGLFFLGGHSGYYLDDQLLTGGGCWRTSIWISMESGKVLPRMVGPLATA